MEMLKMFVIMNSLVVFITMAWPHMKESFTIIQEYFYEL